MFSIDSAINTIENGNKQLIKTFVINQDAADIMTDLMTRNSAYAKEITKSATDVANLAMNQTTKMMQTFSTMDYEKTIALLTKPFRELGTVKSAA